MDLLILYEIQNFIGSEVFNLVMPAITFLGEWGILWIVIGVSLTISKRFRPYGITLLLALIITAFIGNIVIKPLVARDRPFIADPNFNLIIQGPSSFSFPSGHSASSFAAAVIVCFMPIKRYWKFGACLVAFLIAFSRLYLFVHYPSDVLTGALLGILIGLALGFLLKRYLAQGGENQYLE